MRLKTIMLGLLVGAQLLPSMAATALADDDKGITLRVAYDTAPVSLDIQEQLSIGMLQLSHLAFDPLVRWNRDLEFEPRLATSWERLDDTTMRLHLRHGVTFHSGNAFTATDVVWTVRRLKRSPDFKAIFDPVERIEAVDDFTVDLMTRQPYPLLLNLATYIFPMDSRFYTGMSADGRDKSEIVKNGNSFASSHLSGTGPFEVVKRQPGTRTEFIRFPNYWDQHSPGNVDHLVMTPIAENATRVAALLAGDVDFISPVPFNAVQRLRHADGFELVTMPGTRITMLQLNEQRVPAFRDPRVRRAFAYAVNQSAIAERLLKGFATPAGQMSPEGYAGHVAALEPRYDLAKARKLMQEAGYAEGFSVTLMAPNNRYVNDAQTAQVALAVAAMLARINVTVEFETLPKNQYWAEYDERAADMMMMGWYSDTSDSANFFEYLTFCPDPVTGAGRYNASEYCNPQIDALVRRANLTMQPEARARLLRQAERAIHDDAPFIPLYWQNLAWASADRVEIAPVLNVMNMPYLGDVVVHPR
ncbi:MULTISPECIES: ABC transporter substrate-binding protein [Salinicola]|uniref:Nickel/dipeptide/oligopeptide ABC transporter substrate-binding protein n=1 Tax=Salinicola socius TaxID=404433 RepID=A0A1Q8SVQ1_9GAMM|nr:MULTISPECIES: ABC transporter substrate-binding protein [Salinicola]OLO05506.1 nickel/dipeptide/oligopeptide ABC transporter substrate-binding protein [Salinicola socius]